MYIENNQEGTVILVTDITVSPGNKTLVVGESDLLMAEVTPANAANKDIIWSSEDQSVASVNSISGMVTALHAGNTTIYATAQDGSGVVGACEIEVKNPILVDSISFEENNIVLNKCEYWQLVAIVSPSNAENKKLTWKSSDESVVSVTSKGLVKGLAAGTAIICATAEDSGKAYGTCTVKVKQTTCCPQEETPKNTVAENAVEDPVDAYTGAHLIRNAIMGLFGGQNINLIAQYDSTQLSCGMLGLGWYHNYEKYVEIDGCDAFVYSSPSVFSKYTSTDDSCSVFECCSPNRAGYVLTVDRSKTHPYILNCNSARVEHYNANGDLAKVVDHQGFETLIAYEGNQITITDTVSGKKIYIEKDAECRISRVYDDASRQATFVYTNGLLTEIHDVNGNIFAYTYDEDFRVKSGTDGNGVRYFENTYDEFGRVVEQKDAIEGSIKSVFIYDGNRRIITDRNGKQSIREYNPDGLLVKYTDANGNATTYEYDAAYNVTKETDANGNSIIRTYNCYNKPAEITDRNGHKTRFEYDDCGNLISIYYPTVAGINPVERFTHNGDNQIIQHVDIRGVLTTYTYDVNRMLETKKVGSKNAMHFSFQNGLLQSKTDAAGNVTHYSYNSIGQLVAITDADNNTNLYEYDQIGNLLMTTDPNGKTSRFTYDGNCMKTSATDFNGNVTLYSYNGNLKNEKVTLPDGNTIRYNYDGEDRLIRMTDQANNANTIVYDDAGRMIAKHFADGAIIRYEYDAAGRVVKEINPKGAVTTKTYDGNGNVLSQTDDDGNTTFYEYNAMSKVTKVINAVAGSTVYEYSPAGDLLSETDALGNRKVYTYDAYGNRLTATDAKNNVTAYTYDANNNLLTVKDALNHTTTYTYNCLNQCVAVKDALNNVIRYGYDALGRRTTVTDARGNVFTTVYDANGNVVKTLDAKGNTISETVFNSLNLPVRVTDAMGKSTCYTYTELGKVATITDPMNHCSVYAYDSLGRNTSVQDAANNTSTVTYDLLGNVTRLAGPLGGATNYTYDDMGRLISESTVSGGTVQYTYNELNIRKKRTNARGQVRQMFYDNCGRITGYTDPEGSVSYTYDANGNVLTVTDRNGVITRTYDALNRVVSCTDTNGNLIRYEYDEVGNLTKLIYPDNTVVNYAYDANHNLVRVTDWAGRVTLYTYDVNNRIIGVTKPDGSVVVTVYDNKQRVTSTVERTASGTVISGFEYTYDDLSRIVEEKVLSNSTKMCYTYDSLSRVTKRTVNDLSDAVLSEESFAYDAAGNITAAPNDSFLYDTNNRLVAFNGNAVTYDLDGNMLSDGVVDYTYDSANRLVAACDHTYTYNAEDVRIRNLCDEEDTTYVYNTNCRLSQLLVKTTNGVATKYVYGHGLIGEEVGNTFKTYHFDCRGSTVAITDASGNITDTFAYDTYGKMISRTGTSQIIFGYNGRDGVVTDGNGLIYMRARYYAPDMRRFINADIVPGEISNAVTLNRFAYANGNPVSLVDPFGLAPNHGEYDIAGLLAIAQRIYDGENNLEAQFLAITMSILFSYKGTLLNADGAEVRLPITESITVGYSVKLLYTQGNAEITQTISENFEILGSYVLPLGDNQSVSISLDGSLTVSCSKEVDEYLASSHNVSVNLFSKTITVSHSVTNSRTNPGLVSEIFLEYTPPKNDNDKNTQKYPFLVPNPVPHLQPATPPITAKKPGTTPSIPAPRPSGTIVTKPNQDNYGVVVAGTILAGTIVVAGVALVETVATGGIGAWNDVLAIAAVIEAGRRFIEAVGSSGYYPGLMPS